MAPDRPAWRTQTLVLIVIAVLGTLPFWLSDLDLRVAAHFYHPETDDPWREAGLPLWSFFYRAVPVLTAVLMLGALIALAAGAFASRWRSWRLPAALLLLTGMLGPGLLINGVLKEHWDRPRPHQVEALGGTKDYLPPLRLGIQDGGKSFPSGHSSVGYLLLVFYLLWRPSRPRLALAALIVALALGTLLGVGRMAAGDHFLSDVIWSGVITYAVALILYFGVLRIPQRQSALAIAPAPPPLSARQRLLLGVAAALGGSLLLFGVLLATPVSENKREVIRQGAPDPSPRVLRIEADYADLVVYGMDGSERALVRLQARGFGLPGARVDRGSEVRDGVLTYRIVHRGVFTERDTRLVVAVVAGQWDRIEARVGTGDIRVQSGGLTGPAMDLVSKEGTVLVE
ncbi:MAG: phosphatase PAP2 family protein [Bdellovibrio bacteriovorus]